MFVRGFGIGNVQVCVFVCDDMVVVAIKEQQGQGREGSVIGGTTKQRPRKTTLGVINLVREDRPFDYPWVASVML